jgi:hypothetical protein
MAARLTEKQLTAIDKYNSSIKGLCRLVSLLDKDNAVIELIKNRISLFLESNPTEAINISGEYINKYKEKIDSKDESFFLSGGISDELKNANSSITSLFELIKEKWPKLSIKEKDDFWQKIEAMVKAYVVYTT